MAQSRNLLTSLLKAPAKGALRARKLQSRLDKMAATVESFVADIRALDDVAPPRGFTIPALARIFKRTETARLVAALADSGKLEEVAGVIPPEAPSKAILATSILVGVETSLLIVIDNWEEIESLVEAALAGVDDLLGFDLTAIDRLRGILANAPGLAADIEISFVDLVQAIKGATEELDRVTAEAMGSVNKYADRALDLAKQAETLVPVLSQQAQLLIEDGRTSAAKTIVALTGKLEEGKEALASNAITLAEEL